MLKQPPECNLNIYCIVNQHNDNYFIHQTLMFVELVPIKEISAL